MKVHKLEVLIVDFDDLGKYEVMNVLENTRYANSCIAPSVLTVSTKEVDWSNNHPLNKSDQQFSAAALLFGAAVPVEKLRELPKRLRANGEVVDWSHIQRLIDEAERRRYQAESQQNPPDQATSSPK